jgi:CRISPR system Cascade subunit CasA
LSNLSPATFNLWPEPWITVERPSGQIHTLSIKETLLDATRIHALYDPSPLVVAGIHRLLVAILQTMYAPQNTPELLQIWHDGCFQPARVADFGERYTDRFDLFSEDTPFYQSADLSLQPTKGQNAKPVSYLLEERPAGTAVTHYHHSYDGQTFCSRCAAKGLVVMPAFASSGGAGIKPSINGVPPIYVLPGGQTLFHSLVASLTTPAYQPGIKSDEGVWWQRSPPTVVEKKGEVRRVSYLHSLTFPARRIRLHPVSMSQPCSRCGQKTTWGVQTMVYEMGEDRTSSTWWRDPFAAYRISAKPDANLLPVRPVEGRPLWREFRALFLPQAKDSEVLRGFRPAVLDQIEEVWRNDNTALPFTAVPLRVIGLRTDMKMKIFEWEENGFLVPPHLLSDFATAETIQAAIEFATAVDGIIKSTFRAQFGGGGKAERYATLKKQMSRHYWQRLGQRFQEQLPAYAAATDLVSLFHNWLNIVLQEAQDVFWETVESLPRDGSTLRKRQEAIIHCRKMLYGYRQKNYPKPQEEPE